MLLALFVSVWDFGSASETFYVGVTYCGGSVEEAKLLVDKVKNYTNVFCLQSGILQHNSTAVTAIGDYAVASGLSFIPSFGSMSYHAMKNWLNTYDNHWEDKFLGVYFGDEPAGKMVDGTMSFFDEESQSTLRKQADGSISCQSSTNNFSTSIYYRSDQRVIIEIGDDNGERFVVDGKINPDYVHSITKLYFFPNGTVTSEVTEYPNTLINTNQGIMPFIGNHTVTQKILEDYNITFTHEQLINMRPFQTYDEAADRFIKECSINLEKYVPKQEFMTSDYVLHWFDYKAGYQTILAQFGWNHTLAQDIALVRGAAGVQNKSWGVIITWKYINSPYLASGEEIYDQLVLSYKAGAQYVLLFNYAEDMQGPCGTLQQEHFVALEQFWNEVFKSSKVKHGSVKPEAVLVLPQNYGWAMRNPNDKIWGLWGPDEKSEQIWQVSRSLIEEYGTSLDMVYEDPQFGVEGKYSKIFYWNQTG